MGRRRSAATDAHIARSLASCSSRVASRVPSGRAEDRRSFERHAAADPRDRDAAAPSLRRPRGTPRDRPAPGAHPHRAFAAHERPERRARVRRSARRVPHLGRGGRSAAGGGRRRDPLRRPRQHESPEDPADPRRGPRARRRVRSVGAGVAVRRRCTRVPDLAPGDRSEDRGGRAQLRARPRHDPRRHARAPHVATAGAGPPQGVGRASRPPPARPRPRRAAHAPARRARSGSAGRSARHRPRSARGARCRNSVPPRRGSSRRGPTDAGHRRTLERRVGRPRTAADFWRQG